MRYTALTNNESMLNLYSLFVVATLMSGVFAIIWTVCAGIYKNSRSAMLHWMLTNTTICMASYLAAMRGEWPDLLTYLGSDLLFVTAFFSMRRGLQFFTGASRTDWEQLGLLIVGGLGMAYQRSFFNDAGHFGAILILSILASYALLSMTTETFRYMREHFNRLTISIMLMPLILNTVIFSARTVSMIFGSQVAGVGNPSFFLIQILFLLLLNVSLATVVVSRLIGEIRQLSVTDPLTQIFNRRRLEEAYASEKRRRKRSLQPLSILMLDIDHFKRVNDLHGHAVGDAALINTASIMKKTARDSDIVGRLGGEEFCMILPDTSEDGVRGAAERLRKAIEASVVHVGDLQFNLTASLGTATITRVSDESWSDLMKRVDGALYEAKRNGRNQVCVSATVSVT